MGASVADIRPSLGLAMVVEEGARDSGGGTSGSGGGTSSSGEEEEDSGVLSLVLGGCSCASTLFVIICDVVDFVGCVVMVGSDAMVVGAVVDDAALIVFGDAVAVDARERTSSFRFWLESSSIFCGRNRKAWVSLSWVMMSRCSSSCFTFSCRSAILFLQARSFCSDTFFLRSLTSCERIRRRRRRGIQPIY